MQDILISVAKIQCDLGYGETVKVTINGETFNATIAAIDNRRMAVRLDDGRMICDYPIYKLAYHEIK
jgi:hypothetical protein